MVVDKVSIKQDIDSSSKLESTDIDAIDINKQKILLLESTDIDALDITKQKFLLFSNRFHQNTKNRKWLASWTTVVVSVWLACVLIILSLNSSLQGLSDNVIIALLGTTILNVLGLSYIVLKGYFQIGDKSEAFS